MFSEEFVARVCAREYFTLDCRGQDGESTQAVIDIDWDTTSFAASSCTSATCCPGTQDCTILVITTELYEGDHGKALQACNGQTLCSVRASWLGAGPYCTTVTDYIRDRDVQMPSSRGPRYQ